MEILGLGSKVDVDFIFDRQDQRKQIDIRIDDNKRVSQYIYYDGEDVNGQVRRRRRKTTKNFLFFVFNHDVLGTN